MSTLSSILWCNFATFVMQIVSIDDVVNFIFDTPLPSYPEIGYPSLTQLFRKTWLLWRIFWRYRNLLTIGFTSVFHYLGFITMLSGRKTSSPSSSVVRRPSVYQRPRGQLIGPSGAWNWRKRPSREEDNCDICRKNGILSVQSVH